MIVMSDIAYDWIALGVAAILFVILAFLKRKKTRVSPHACCLQRHSVSFWESLSTATLIMSARWVPSGPTQLPHWWFRCCCSASSPASRTLESPMRLKSIGAKTVFFLLLNTDEVESNPLLQSVLPCRSGRVHLGKQHRHGSSHRASVT